jgi:hypothetical protein
MKNDYRLKGYFDGTTASQNIQLDTEYRINVEPYYKKYKFKEIKDTSELNSEVKEKYKAWVEWDSKFVKFYKKRAQEEKIFGYYIIWYVSIGIGVLLLSILSVYEIIERRILKMLIVLLIIFLIWFGTSCYAFLLLNYNDLREVSFLNISTQLKFIPLMIIWILNSILIGLIALCVNRFLINLLSFIIGEIDYPGYISPKRFKNENFKYEYIKIVNKDNLMINVLVYGSFAFGLLYFYYSDNIVMSSFENVRRIIIYSSSYAYSLLGPIVFICFVLLYIFAAKQNKGLREIFFISEKKSRQD